MRRRLILQQNSMVYIKLYKQYWVSTSWNHTNWKIATIQTYTQENIRCDKYDFKLTFINAASWNWWNITFEYNKIDLYRGFVLRASRWIKSLDINQKKWER